MSSTLDASIFMGKGILRKVRGNNLTMKLMFGISYKVIVGQSDYMYGVAAITWEDSSWKQFLVSDEEVISLSHAKVYVFSDSVLCLGRVNENPQSNTVWEDKLTWFKRSPQYRVLDTIVGEPMDFEWNIVPGFTTLQHCNKVQNSCQKWAINQKNLKDGPSSCRCSTTSLGDRKTMKRNANLTRNSFRFKR